MNITAADAVNHIVNSLDATSADYWYDVENDVTWVVRGRGADDVIEIGFIDDNDEYTNTQRFKLVEES